MLETAPLIVAYTTRLAMISIGSGILEALSLYVLLVVLLCSFLCSRLSVGFIVVPFALGVLLFLRCTSISSSSGLLEAFAHNLLQCVLSRELEASESYWDPAGMLYLLVLPSLLSLPSHGEAVPPTHNRVHMVLLPGLAQCSISTLGISYVFVRDCMLQTLSDTAISSIRDML